MRRLLRVLAVLGAINVVMYVAGLLARRRYSEAPDEDADEVRLVTIMEGREFRSRAGAFQGGSIVTVFGGAMVDLSAATMAPGGAFLDMRTTFGGVDLVVPAGWRVEYTHEVMAGGFDDRTDASTLPPDAPLLTIRARTVFGGVAVRPRMPEDAAARNGA